MNSWALSRLKRYTETMKQTKKSANTYNPALASLIIRVGLAAVFAYAAIDAFREPDAWVSFMPAFITKMVTAKTALDLISVFQLVLAAALLIGRYIKYVATLTAVMLLGIVVFNTSTFLITFRDIGLIAASIALILLDQS